MRPRTCDEAPASLASRGGNLCPIPIATAEIDRAGNLHWVSLERRPVRNFLKYFAPTLAFPAGRTRLGAKPECIDRVVRDGKDGRKRKSCPAQCAHLLLAHPNEAVHVHDDGVLAGRQDLTIGPFS